MSKPVVNIPYQVAIEIAEQKAEDLREFCQVVLVTGSLRRKAQTIHDIDLLVLPKTKAIHQIGMFEVKTVSFSSAMEGAWPTLINKWHAIKAAEGPKKKKCILPGGIPLEVNISSPESWAVQTVIATGPEAFTVRAVTQRPAGYLPAGAVVKNGWQVYEAELNIQMATEAKFLDYLGLGWIAPEDRK
jgi:DNA polymerase/3'-5' exonuclease PolX